MAENATKISPVAVALIEAGMHKDQALKIARTNPETDVRRKLDILRWRVETGDPPNSSGAWLNDQFRKNYPDPDGYTAYLKAKEAKFSKDARKKELAQAKFERQEKQESVLAEFQATFQAWWADLGDAGRSEINDVIRANEHNDFERRYIDEGETTASGRAIWAAKRQQIFSERTGTQAP